jgi:pseudooxynicotine oxidase
LAQCILSEFKGDTLFNSPVSFISQNDDSVTGTTRDGKKISASHVVCTVPLNVLHSIEFTPPLSTEKSNASKEGQVNRGLKVHAYTKKQIPTMFTNAPPPSPILFGFSESDLPKSLGGGSFSVYFCQENVINTSSASAIADHFTEILE